ncbi:MULTISPECIES: hypothetical protein [unclassified Arcobacter]|jgi:hypothetical protein|uniref:hypothetical protein n=1 Tax=Arcobacter TaxID=28196 RepID=UPI0035D3FE4D|tara:strand:+ start:176 stop:367 length:192 start_codon:yes stop_codon:yes gene_type:complete
MEELILTKEELVEMFENHILEDTQKGWLLDKKVVEIIALHEVEPKYLQDITNAKYYKIIPKGN